MRYSIEDHISRKECGGCKHWCAGEESQKTGLTIGNCDKIPKGRKWESEGKTYFFDGETFEDECYNDDFGCFEEMVKDGTESASSD